MLALLTASLWLSLAALAPATPGPTLAKEDTMHTEVPEVLVRAPRVTLDEILDRVARGEARRESLLVDQSFRATFRVVRNVHGKGEPSLFMETVSRVYKKRPAKVRSVTLRHWQAKGKSDNADIRFRAEMDEPIVNSAFRPEARREYRYRIVGRDLVGNQVIYRIAFEPRSAIDRTLPSGVVWVNTNDFVIVRQELSFVRSPAPLFIKDVTRMVIERQRSAGHWVLHRVLLRAETTLPIPQFGRSFDISLQFDDYAINRGIDDRIFATERP